ncbi:hypothetical protein PR003_g25706, partial [Phytophthora rubi]
MTTPTTTTTFTTKLKTFNGTGFPAWGTQVRLILELKGLWDAFQEPAPSSADVKTEKSTAAAASASPATPGSSLVTSATPLYDRLMKQKMAISIILAVLSEKLAAEVYLLPHPMKIMHHLRMTYNVNAVQASERPRDKHHVEVGDEEKRQNFMHSLGPAWNGFIGVLEASSTFEDMLNRCQAEAIRRAQQKGRHSTSSAVSGGGKATAAFNTEVKSNMKSSKKKLDVTKIKCFNCQKMGHFARDCTNEHVDQVATKAEAASMAFSVEDG